MLADHTGILTESQRFRRVWRLLTAGAGALAGAAFAVALMSALLAARLYRSAVELQRTMATVRRAAQLYLEKNARETPRG